MCIFHKWGKWEQYDVIIPPRILSKQWRLSGATEHRQKKKCEKCGKIKDAYIGITVY
jgi:hypothetical protein